MKKITCGFNVIGIAGPARSGKDTAASIICSEFHGFYQYSLATPMKRMLAAGFGIDMSSPYWAERKEDIIPALGRSPRQLLQTLGTEWGRELVAKNVWLVTATKEYIKFGPGMVISDVRFDNEAEWVRDLGGLLIHISRKDCPLVNAHSSEAGIRVDDHDLVLANDGTIEELKAQLLQGIMNHEGF